MIRQLNNPSVKKMLEFIAKFITMKLKEEDDADCDDLGDFLSKVFDHILTVS
jgi:hypothetical protein